jgi:hypothetical protein
LGIASKLKNNFFQRMKTGDDPSNKSSLPNQIEVRKVLMRRDSMMTNARSKSSAIGQSTSQVYSRHPRRASVNKVSFVLKTVADHDVHDFHTSGPRDVSISVDKELLFYNGEPIIQKPKPNYVFTGEWTTHRQHGSDSGGKNGYGCARDMFRDIDSNNYNSLEGQARRANEEGQVKTLSEWERNIEVLKSNKSNEFSMNNLAEMPLANDNFMYMKDALDYNFGRAANAKKISPERPAPGANMLANF